MKDISLKTLLEAGCHFGHRVERWHPKAVAFIYQPREGIHIIDLVKTRDSILKAGEVLYEAGIAGKTILFVGTKRQAKGVVSEAAKRVGAFYLTNRWIGGFLTNWDAVKRNIEKVRRMRAEQKEGAWNQFPKHEQVKLEKELRKLEMVYSGVADMTTPPDALVIVDVKKENIAVAEGLRRGITTIAMVDTNADPASVDYPVPANDDAVGSIQCVINYLADTYEEGKVLAAKNKKKNDDKAAAELLKKEAGGKTKEEKAGETQPQQEKAAKPAPVKVTAEKKEEKKPEKAAKKEAAPKAKKSVSAKASTVSKATADKGGEKA